VERIYNNTYTNLLKYKIMPFLDVGFRQGLAVSENWNTDMNFALKEEAMHNASQARKDDKVAAIADKVKFADANNSYDKAQLKDYYKNVLIPSIGKYVAENPDWEHNVTKRVEFNNLLNQFKDNPIAARAARVDAEHKAFATYLAKNKEDMTDPDITRMAGEYQNYEKTGSTDGVTKNAKEFMFTPPEKYDINADAAAVAKQLNPTETPFNDGAFHGIKYVYDPDKIAAAATAKMAFMNHGDKIKKIFNNELTPEQQKMYLTPQGYYEHLIESYLPKQGYKSYDQTHYGKSYGEDDDFSGTTAWLAMSKVLNDGTKHDGLQAHALLSLTDITGTEKEGYTLNRSKNGFVNMYYDLDGKQVPLLIKNREQVSIDDGSTGEIVYDTNANGEYVPAFVKARVNIGVEDASRASISKNTIVNNFYEVRNDAGVLTGYAGDVLVPVDPAKLKSYNPLWSKMYNVGDKTSLIENIKSIPAGTKAPAATGTTAPAATGTTKSDVLP
jgi:hypothetical protein